MIIPDLNLLIYAYNRDAPFHHKAAAWWESCINGFEPVGIPWVVLIGFVRLLSGRSVVPNPYPLTELFSICDSWLSFSHVLLLQPSTKTYELFQRVMIKNSLPANMVTDSVIAATAIEHNAVLYSNDTDYERFKELKLKNPLRT